MAIYKQSITIELSVDCETKQEADEVMLALAEHIDEFELDKYWPSQYPNSFMLVHRSEYAKDAPLTEAEQIEEAKNRG